VALLCACGDASGGPPDGASGLPVAEIVVGNRRVDAEIAATPAARRRGLMFRERLQEDHGMLFLFPRERVLSFWMKNTPLPLSIAFADAEGRILRIADLEPHSEAAVSSGAPALYALEMSRGWFARNAVLEGDRILRIPRPRVE
jgi:uncharacterized membrane protein (UPF0127 family)